MGARVHHRQTDRQTETDRDRWGIQRERERETARERERQRQRGCVCVCERQTDRQKKRDGQGEGGETDRQTDTETETETYRHRQMVIGTSRSTRVSPTDWQHWLPRTSAKDSQWVSDTGTRRYDAVRNGTVNTDTALCLWVVMGTRGRGGVGFYVALRPRRRDDLLGTGTEWEGDRVLARPRKPPEKTGETVDRRQNNGSVKAVSPRHCPATCALRNCSSTAVLDRVTKTMSVAPLLMNNLDNSKQKTSNLLSPAPPPYSWSLLGKSEGPAPPPSSKISWSFDLAWSPEGLVLRPVLYT